LLCGLAVILRLQLRKKLRERERFEQQAVALEDKRRLAEAANLEKSRFLAAASHDLRQPVHAMNLYLGTLAGLELPAPATALLANARQCGQSMDEMFRTVLDLSRLDASALYADIEEFALEPLLERIRLQFGPQARLKGLVLRVPRSRVRLKSDPQLVERILHNFVANAVRYTTQGKVLVGARRRGTQVRLSVFDTGPGVPTAEQQRIFEEFYQLDASSHERIKGLGLGLAIVRRLATLLQAPLALRSVPGKGSCFAVDLPCAQGSRLPLATSVPTPALEPVLPAGTFRALQGALLLVVDDDESIREATRVLLEQFGAEVVTAASGAELFESMALSRGIPDGLICDYRLRGGEDGIGLVARIRTEFNHEIPALLITGETSATSLREIQASGLPVLHKPLMPDELRQELLRLIQCGQRQAA
jgi:CheY-like chemotaxis protein